MIGHALEGDDAIVGDHFKIAESNAARLLDLQAFANQEDFHGDLCLRSESSLDTLPEYVCPSHCVEPDIQIREIASQKMRRPLLAH